ncbi:hypothetical protein C8Q74DRAFT_752696 [Fomes fomentarius]|nr:hypothetical protein C8Q74DRAFT_752696 [Fomes fomentarius]
MHPWEGPEEYGRPNVRVRVATNFRVQTAVFGDDERSRRCDTRVNVAALATHPQLLRLRLSTLRLLASLPCSLTSTFLLLKRFTATQTKKHWHTRRPVSTRSLMSEARHAPRAQLPDRPPPYPGWHNVRPRRGTICAPHLGRINGRGVGEDIDIRQVGRMRVGDHDSSPLRLKNKGAPTRGCTGARYHRWRELRFKDNSRHFGNWRREEETVHGR